MEQTWEQTLAGILAKEPAALTPGDIEFLRARKSYLTPKQLETYAEQLGSVTEEKVAKKSK
jgi:hypothetical protein